MNNEEDPVRAQQPPQMVQLLVISDPVLVKQALSMLYTTMWKQKKESVKTSLLASDLQGRFSKSKKVLLKLYI